MPVTLGKNLNINDNRLESYSKSVYEKLNKAKAWTNTETTESGGTVSVIYNNDVIQTYPCGINDFYCKSAVNNVNSIFIINGIMYRCVNGSIYQVGDKTNWVKSSYSNYTTSSSVTIGKLYAIDSNNDLYSLTNITSTGAVGSITLIDDTNDWTDILALVSGGWLIGSGKLYSINRNVLTQVGTDNDWTKLSGFGESYCSGLRNGYPYFLTFGNGGSMTLLSSENNKKDIFCNYSTTKAYNSPSVIDNNNDRYFYILDTNNQQWYEFKDTAATFKFKKIIYENSTSYYTTGGNIFAISTDNDLYFKRYGSPLTISSVQNYNIIPYTPIAPDKKWLDCIFSYNRSEVLALSLDGKLYRIQAPDYRWESYTVTEIDSNSYQKLEGMTYNTSSDKGLALAWSGDATSVSHTVYTTKSPQAGDTTYSDNELTPYSTIVSVSGTTVTDEYRTYDVDIAKDSSFTSIPPASVHETVGTMELLNALNPNS